MNTDFLPNFEKYPKRRILIGLTGSIACYKTCELIRMLVKANFDVKVVLSPAALEFIGYKTLETISNNPVYCDMFAPKQDTKHISLADWADLFVIAYLTRTLAPKSLSYLPLR